MFACLATVLGACGATPPSPEDRAQDRNANPPEREDAIRVAGGDVGVVTYGWVNEAEDAGCGVVLVNKRTEEWMLFARVPGRSVRWDTISGATWRVDSPDGLPSDFNATSDAAGRITLNEDT